MEVVYVKLGGCFVVQVKVMKVCGGEEKVKKRCLQIQKAKV